MQLVNDKGLKFGVVATNIFKEPEEKWFLTHHHGSALSNYFRPNSEIFWLAIYFRKLKLILCPISRIIGQPLLQLIMVVW